MKEPTKTLQAQIKSLYCNNTYEGLVHIFLFCLLFFFYVLLTIFQPADKIDRVIDFPIKKYQKYKNLYGDHTFNLFKNKK